MILMVAMLVCMGSSVMAATPRDQVYIKKIMVYPTYDKGQGAVKFANTYVNKIYSNYEPYGGIQVSVAKQNEFWNKYKADGYNQVGWSIVIDYLVDTTSYSSCTIRHAVEGRNTTTLYNVSGGMRACEYWVDGTSKVPSWAGTITRPNGLDYSFWAVISIM